MADAAPADGAIPLHATLSVRGVAAGSASAGFYERLGMRWSSGSDALAMAQSDAAHYHGPLAHSVTYDLAPHPDHRVNPARSALTFARLNYTADGGAQKSHFTTRPIAITGAILSAHTPSGVSELFFTSTDWYTPGGNDRNGSIESGSAAPPDGSPAQLDRAMGRLRAADLVHAALRRSGSATARATACRRPAAERHRRGRRRRRHLSRRYQCA